MVEPSDRQKKPHLRPLTGLRFLAALHVVVYHNFKYVEVGWPGVPKLVSDLALVGYSGVNLFFVLSGFILTYTYFDFNRQHPLVLNTSRRTFFMARVARIYPLYLLSLVMVSPFVITHFLSANGLIYGTAKIATSATTSAFLLQAWVPPLRSIWNSPGWTLSAEAFFYLLFPVIATRIAAVSDLGKRLILVGCLVSSFLPWLISIVILDPAIHQTAATDTIPKSFASIFLSSAPILRIHEFIAGICLALLITSDQGNKSSLTKKLVRFGGPILLLALIVIVSNLESIPRLLVHSGVLNFLNLSLIVYLYFGLGWFPRILGSSWMVQLGQASYAVYILHAPIAQILKAVAPRDGPLGLGFFFLYLCVVISLSLLAYRFVEEPARRFIKNRWAKQSV